MEFIVKKVLKVFFSAKITDFFGKYLQGFGVFWPKILQTALDFIGLGWPIKHCKLLRRRAEK